MSEYQYYEFLAIDSPLTEEEQQAVARLSSRVDPHPWRAVFTYSWSDFPGSPKRVLAQYYDAMLYMANWGSCRLMFRFPRTLVDTEQMRQYAVETTDYSSEALDVSIVGEYAILNIEFHDDAGGEWIEGEGWLDALVPLREAILRQDYRLLYLAWLRALDTEDVDEEALEPPVPPGLGKLTHALRSFAELFDIDADLLRVAVAQSADVKKAPSDDDLRRAISTLAVREKDDLLLRLAKGESHLSLALTRRLGDLTGVPQSEEGARRTVGELLAMRKALREGRRKERAAKARARRIAELEALAQREEETWAEVDALIQTYQPKAYDEAVRLLVKLKELAGHQGQEPAFQERMGQVSEQYKRRHSLIKRFRQAGLV